ALRLPITLDYAAPPSQVKELLLQAVGSAQDVCREPKPRVFLKDFAESGVEYEIKFWMEDHGLYSDACDAIRSHIWYGLRRQGIRIPFPTRTLHLEHSGRERQPKAENAARLILREQPLFNALNDEQLESLLRRGRTLHF